ncbi:acyl-CoA dehydrogenase [Baffinella frigidus]|nr:acyl-CoA dehydrogenase [Cryptophyta sp. CCMP2293]
MAASARGARALLAWRGGAVVRRLSSGPAMSPKAQHYAEKVTAFMHAHVYPAEAAITQHAIDPLTKWTIPPGIGKHGAGLTIQEYARLAEIMGAVPFASEVFNCSAPDTGNMEVILKYGTPEQQERFLPALLSGAARSCFAMTEPDVASSDATNITSTIARDGDGYKLNGRKWWTSGAMDPRCNTCIFMGKTDLNAPRHLQQSMVLVPFDAPGVKVVRPLSVFGFDDAPHGHAEVLFKDVEVPASNLLLGEGRGFEIAQGRLGPGRIHHCMRLIGLAERALALHCLRVDSRVAFGQPLSKQGSVREDIAYSRLAIDQARLLCLEAARVMDTQGNKAARGNIALIKVAAPQMAVHVIDKAIQAHGGAGFCQDFPLAFAYAQARVLQMADGPDQVHLQAVAKIELARHAKPKDSPN